MKEIRAVEYFDAEVLAGELLGEESFDTLIREDAIVYKPDGSPLLIFKKAALTKETSVLAFKAIRGAANPTYNRVIAAGKIEGPKAVRANALSREAGKTRTAVVKLDGTVSKTNVGKEVKSGIIGYFDRNTRFPYCRQTAWTAKNPDKWVSFLPYVQEVSENFKELHPERYRAQSDYCAKTPDDFVIPGTVFTTITVNKNWQTAVHTDRGDLKEGFGVLTAFSAGKYEGGYLCFPAYKVAVDIRTTDILLADVHEWHGNTPIEPRGAFERLSCVFYYRNAMHYCGTLEQELEAVKNRKQGSPLKRVKTTSGTSGIEVQFAVPSYNRWESVGEKTLDTLRRYGIARDDITIFVADEKQETLYREYVDPELYGKIVIAEPGIHKARNFIHKYYPEGTKVFSLDDDIKGFVKKLDDKTLIKAPCLKEMIEDGFKACEAHGAKTWGVYPVKNPMFMKNRISAGLKFLIGFSYGFISLGEGCEELTLPVKEDYQWCVLRYLSEGCTVRLDGYTADTKVYAGAGGLQDDRTPEVSDAAAAYLIQEYPELIREKKNTKSGHREVSFRRIKTRNNENEM
jgi:hypothetical protein